MRTKSKTKTRRPPSLPRTSDEMKRWSAMLASELRGWPHITTKPMFGLLGLYRRKTIFAALPVTRGIGAPNTILFKIKSVPPDLLRRANGDPRVSTGTRMRAKGWHCFDVNSAEDLKDVLWWLNQAYELAKG
jgi:hypothetical protein